LRFQTDHVLLVGKGANRFAEEMGIESVPTDELVTDEARREWEQYVKFNITVNTLFKQRLAPLSINVALLFSDVNKILKIPKG
jgi:isoaspartyl peptidase/L-asparaginase-like protein (Ntn-hydrolase superfamily)